MGLNQCHFSIEASQNNNDDNNNKGALISLF